MGEASTGFDDLKNEFPKHAIIFNDPICPTCGEKLYILSKPIRNERIKIRFECLNCGFICPIKRDEDDLEHLEPAYDTTVHDFIQSFISLKQEKKEPKNIKKKKKKKL